MKKLYCISIILVIVLCAGCSDDNDDHPSSPVTTGRAALVIVAEDNRFSAGDELFMLYRTELIEIFAELFGIDVAAMEGMTLEEILDVYGEPWMISELEKVANPYYSKIIGLTDETATTQNFLATLDTLAAEGYVIDLIFSLHGNVNRVCFFPEACEPIETITTSIAARGIPVRALYQTCCYGSSTIDDWEQIGIMAVSGAKGLNNMVQFSPIYFLQHWTGGMAFEGAVEAAFYDEIATLRSYQTRIPAIEEFLTDEEVLDRSTQVVGGHNRALMWQDFSAFQDYFVR